MGPRAGNKLGFKHSVALVGPYHQQLDDRCGEPHGYLPYRIDGNSQTDHHHDDLQKLTNHFSPLPTFTDPPWAFPFILGFEIARP